MVTPSCFLWLFPESYLSRFTPSGCRVKYDGKILQSKIFDKQLRFGPEILEFFHEVLNRFTPSEISS